MSDSNRQCIIIGMIDGFGLPYYDGTDLPVIKGMAGDGFFKRTTCVFPSVTNVNNVSIATGAWPADHGITANSYFDQAAGTAQYMNAAELIRAETIFKRARRRGVKSVLLTAKRKSVELFRKDADIAVTAEDPPEAFIERFGRPANIYSREINYWLWEVAAGLLESDREIGLVYVHTTDYPMHKWPVGAHESVEHLQELDRLIGRCREIVPGAAFFLTADHSMNAKTRNWDLARVCEDAGTPVRFALSPERDYYIAHHKNYTGCAWLWLKSPADEPAVRRTLEQVEGVESILSRNECAARYHTIPERLGDLNVMGDVTTMFGEADTAHEKLAPDYRAHGSLHEMDVPLIISNFKGRLPDQSFFNANKDVAAFLWQGRNRKQAVA